MSTRYVPSNPPFPFFLRCLREQGYDHRSMQYSDVRELYESFVHDSNLSEDAELPFASEISQARLLLEALKYTDLGVAAKVGAGQAREHRMLHQKDVKWADKKSNESKNSLFRDRHKAQFKKLQQKSGAVSKEAREIVKTTVTSAPLSRSVLAVIKQLKLAPHVLKALNVTLKVENAELQPSDDEAYALEA